MPIKISQLTALGTVDGTVVIPVVDIGGVTPISKKSTISDVSDFILQGNAATATKLATARNINGVAFDGTADITITTSLAAATTSTIGGVIVGSGISVETDGTISVDTISVATTTVAGTVIVGNGLVVEDNGTITVSTTAFHGFSVDSAGDVYYTKMDSGDFAIQDSNNNEIYIMYEIGTSDYSWAINDSGELVIEWITSPGSLPPPGGGGG